MCFEDDPARFEFKDYYNLMYSYLIKKTTGMHIALAKYRAWSVELYSVDMSMENFTIHSEGKSVFITTNSPWIFSD